MLVILDLFKYIQCIDNLLICQLRQIRISYGIRPRAHNDVIIIIILIKVLDAWSRPLKKLSYIWNFAISSWKPFREHDVSTVTVSNASLKSRVTEGLTDRVQEGPFGKAGHGHVKQAQDCPQEDTPCPGISMVTDISLVNIFYLLLLMCWAVWHSEWWHTLYLYLE